MDGKEGREIIIFPKRKQLGKKKRHDSTHAIVLQDIQGAEGTVILP